MSDRYVLIIARSTDGMARMRQLHPPAPEWKQHQVSPRAMLFAAPEARLIAWPNGIIVGTLFARGAKAPLDHLSPADTALVAATRGRVLVDGHWGSYIASLADTDGDHHLLRAPFGDLPCLWHADDHLLCAASDPDLMACYGIAARVDPSRLAAYLGRPDYLGCTTCLAGIDEIRGGEVLRLPETGAPRSEALWSPWRFTADKPGALVDAGDACSRVGGAVRLSVAARTALHPRSVLLLSGGIDSSVVAASLAQAGRDFTCLNFISANAGDESRYARLVAQACGVPFEVGERDPNGVDLTVSAAEGQPRPVARSFMQESTRLAEAAAVRTGASAIVDGGGGDSVFYAYLSAAPAAELWQRESWSPAFRAKVAALASLSGVSRLKITLRAILRAHRASAAHRPPLLDYLSSAARAQIDQIAPHPWLLVPDGVGPGSASYVAGLPPIQGLVETQDPRPRIASIAPLISQPVVEACLRVPSWLWFEPWNSRVVVREAFRDALPPAIIDRRSKGTPESFVAGIFEERRQQIQDLLFDGALAAMGLIDREALASDLSVNSMTRGYAFNRILRLVDAEAWARSWPGGGRL